MTSGVEFDVYMCETETLQDIVAISACVRQTPHRTYLKAVMLCAYRQRQF